MVAKTLPFKYKPSKEIFVEVGDEISGIIELPRYDSIAPVEKMFIDKHTKDSPDPTKALATLINNVAKSTGRDKKEIWAMVQANESSSLAIEDIEGFMQLRDIQDAVSESRRIVCATAMLKYRISQCADWEIEDVINPDNVHPRMLNHLQEFYFKEVNGWEVTSEETTKEVDEDKLKKILPEETTKK